MKNDFVVTSQVKNYIYFDAINNQFKVPKRKLKYLLPKTEIHKFNEIEKIKLLELEDEKYCGELEIVIVLKGNNKCYISLIKKPTSKRSFKYKHLCKIAENIVSYLEFVQDARSISNAFTQRPKATMA